MRVSIARHVSHAMAFVGVGLFSSGIVEQSIEKAVAASAAVENADLRLCEVGTCFTGAEFCKPGPWCCSWGVCVGVSW